MAAGEASLVLSLLASDLNATKSFYEALGFCMSGGAPESGWLELSFGSVRFQFYRAAPIDTPSSPVLSGTIYLHVAEVDALAHALTGKFALEWGPETMDYGMREFALRDPSGYLLAFAAPNELADLH